MKERADTAVFSTSSGERPHDEYTTASGRNPQREWRQSSQTPQHRTTRPQQQRRTRAETAVLSNSGGNRYPLKMNNTEYPQAAKRVDTSKKDSAASQVLNGSKREIERIWPYPATEASTQLRVKANSKKSGHSRAGRRRLLSLTSTSKPRVKDLIQPYPAIQIHSSVCTQLTAGGKASSCRTPPYRTTKKYQPKRGSRYSRTHLNGVCTALAICCTQEHDGDDPFCIREFHISMRYYVY